MQDQIQRLESLGISTATLNSDMSTKECNESYEKLRTGNVKLFYAAPETLLNDELIQFIKDNLNVSFIAIDECHVVSVWGNSFRPTYNKLGRLREEFPNAPIVALTATLSPPGIEDVIDTLKLNEPLKLIHNLDRDSIVYNIFTKWSANSQVLEIVRDFKKTDCGIIYCMTKDRTEELARFLSFNGFNCKAYHSKINKKLKSEILQEYLSGELNLIVATIAFGMGIDRSDVRYVIHDSVPANIENYMQETGRLSRDGKLSHAYLLYSAHDIKTQIWMNNKSIKNPRRAKIVQNKIMAFRRYCETSQCRREGMLAFFNQTPQRCNKCDNCLGYKTITESLIKRDKIDESN